MWASGLDTLTAGDLWTLVPAFAALALFGAWSAVDGGFSPTWWLPGGLLVAGLALVSVIGGGADLARLPRLQLIALGAFAALTAWSFCSLAWAEVTGDAWDGANRTLLYLLVLCLFASLPWRALTAAVVLAACVVAVTGVGVVWFLEVVSEPSARDFMGGRLANPTGYQNANAALFMMALWPALVVSSRRGAPVVVRALALATATFLAQLAFLCQSRGALFAVPVLVLAMLVLVPGRLRTSVAVALPLVAIALVFENGAAAAARQPVPDLEALGQPELLELADVALERQPLLAPRGSEVAGSPSPGPRGSEVAGSHHGTIADQAQHRQRPGATAASTVEARQAPLHFRQLVAGQLVTAAQLHRAGPARRRAARSGTRGRRAA